MPFTPFHMGPGVAMKAVGGRHFSLMVFGFSQVAMDLEPLVRISRGDAVLHGFNHTYLGAALVALVSVVLGRPICEWLLGRFRPEASSRILSRLWGDARVSWPAAVVGAFAGTTSHVVLDGLMHADMQPWAPLSAGNGLLYLVPFKAVYVGCVIAGVMGVVVMLALNLCSARSQGQPRKPDDVGR